MWLSRLVVFIHEIFGLEQIFCFIDSGRELEPAKALRLLDALPMDAYGSEPRFHGVRDVFAVVHDQTIPFCL